MSDWFHSLPVAWMALLVFGFTYFVVAAIYALIRLLAVGERARAFKSVSPGYVTAPWYRFWAVCRVYRRAGLER